MQFDSWGFHRGDYKHEPSKQAQKGINPSTDKNLFFSKFCALKSGVRLIYGCGLYTDVYGIVAIHPLPLTL